MTFYAVAFNVPSTARALQLMVASLLDCPNWWHYIDTFWIVGAEESADALRDRILRHVPDRERPMLFVAELLPASRAGLLPEHAWDWLRENLPLEVATDAPR